MPFDKETPSRSSAPSPPKSLAQIVAFFLGPLSAAIILSLPAPSGVADDAWCVVAIASWMGIWWIFEAVPLPVTALLPLIFWPLLGIETVEATAANYAHPLFFLFLGSFMIAAAMQSCGLHKRIALNIVSFIGTRPDQVIAGFMIATAALSMWISNTATTVMMYVVAVAVIELSAKQSGHNVLEGKFSIALMLSIAYAASIGGVGTLIGTPPNMLFAGVMDKIYGVEISFLSWMLIGLPVVLCMLPLAWLVLTRWAFPMERIDLSGLKPVVKEELTGLGRVSFKEKAVLTLFICTILGWIFSKQIADVTGLPLTDTTVALIAAILLFTVPLSARLDEFMLDWRVVRDIPLGLVLIFGGSLALASAVSASGLAQSIGSIVTGFGDVGMWFSVLVAIVAMILLTEFTSNTASAATFIPIFASIGVAMGLEPHTLAVPAALGASMAFMLPVATPPNMIVYSYEHLKVSDMIRAGIWLNVIAAVVCFLAVALIANALFGAK